MYALKFDPQYENKPANGSNSSDDERSQNKKIKSSPEDKKIVNFDNEDQRDNALYSSPGEASNHGDSMASLSFANARSQPPDSENEAVRSLSLYLNINSLNDPSSLNQRIN